MAEIDVVEKPAGKNATLLMVLAIVAVIALMAWLAMESARRTVPAPVETRTEAAPPADAVDFATVAAAPQQYAGQTITVSGMAVPARLGERVLWADVIEGDPFLVYVPAATADRIEVGQTVTATGTISVTSQAVIDAWIQEGSLDAGSRDLALASPHYLELAAVVSADDPPAPVQP